MIRLTKENSPANNAFITGRELKITVERKQGILCL